MPLPAPINTFAGNPLDRASERRGDAAWLEERLEDPASLAVALWNGRPLVEDAPDAPGPNAPGQVQLTYIPAPMARTLSGGEERLLFLGLWKETAVFALDLEGSDDPAAGALAGLGRFEELRGAAARLPAADAAIAATAKAVFEWRRRRSFCSNCGARTKTGDGGWRRDCEACEAEHFPRTDPVVIMLPVFGGRCLLGRQAAWPKGMFSALAGFVEPGETIEEACAREIAEESGLGTANVRYHSSQPWPWPSSLMIGLIAQVDDDQAAPDQTELEAVRWFTRDEARALLAGELADAHAPPATAIAHQLIKAWAAQA